MLDLHHRIDDAGQEWKRHVLETTTDRFERRMAQEMSLMRQELAATRISILRWMFGLLMGQLTIILTVMGLIVMALSRPR